MKKALFILFLATPSWALTAGPNGPGTGVDDSSVGTIVWSNPSSITIEDAICSTAVVDGSEVYDNTVSLVKGGTVSGDNKFNTTGWTGTLGYTSYGGSSDLWSLSLTAADINASNFGAVVQSSACVTLPEFTHYLKASNFGFSISGTPLGILLEVKKYKFLAPGSGGSFVKGTRVYTPDGDKDIESFKEGDPVYSFDENTHKIVPNIIDRSWSHWVPTVIELKTEDKMVITTPDHRFFTTDDFVMAENLASNAVVYTQTRGVGKFESLTEKTIKKEKTEVFDIEMKHDPHTFFANGFGVHNPILCLALGWVAAVDYMRITVTYTPAPYITTTKGSGRIGTSLSNKSGSVFIH